MRGFLYTYAMRNIYNMYTKVIYTYLLQYYAHYKESGEVVYDLYPL